ncbi:TetR/AcrR family transcriptional regulator [Streptomyces sp. TS71-3]|uniref:TetR/AcrR family transcriptional regulator n=1 Tax=Streptomyces sp. TS71-3 TaxID=2733862 RepID=UPI001B0EA7F7|nr:TetR/AcrR family transcriptional regulator [Streptomyces sp. TS71-3]GHJ41092.1 TetR family transcriptional regulator [Streptomyces sp. TS71-3]
MAPTPDGSGASPAPNGSGTAPASPAPGGARRGRGRRPADEVRGDILRAAGALLLDGGMATFTIERVAQVAGASKTTIYKWWPSKGALALDGYMRAVEETLAFPDTGDVVADLSTQLNAFVNLIGRTPAGRVLAELIGQAQTDPDLAAAFRDRYSSHRRRLAFDVLERAQRRGQIRPDADPRVVIDQLWGACYHRLLIPDEPITEEFGDALIDNLVRGLLTAPVRAEHGDSGRSEPGRPR